MAERIEDIPGLIEREDRRGERGMREDAIFIAVEVDDRAAADTELARS